MKPVKVLPLAIYSVIFFMLSCDPNQNNDQDEIIEIQDYNFRYALLNTNAVDTDNDGVGDRNIDLNNDGQIQLGEIKGVESLILGFNYGLIQNSVDIKEIRQFSNLKYLEITSSEDNGFILSTYSGKIPYNFNALHELEVLKINHLSSNRYTGIDVSYLDKLRLLDLTHNRPDDNELAPEEWEYPTHFIKVYMEGCTSLEEMIMENSFLIVNFCEAPSIKKLNMRYLEGGEPEVFDFHCLEQLEELEISENIINTLILKNGSVLNKFWANYIGNFDLANYPFVREVCIDDMPEELEQISEIINEDTLITTDCIF
ncbi:hypothetical protein [Zunongwangia atlantica]|uniref:Leucine-rich repeat domain-containing protein n=1 Tax=Zunongwangia atlantica 22II14-10F7 TaxID=1185767 RepID=A0A1Y1SYL7_9FLAO|nr:hypothetical protein [Zunongwangia atlantica]ORL43849.1 hypothetical protein IIF7_18649 [Zunongwangia atlantica 22II14-10F7]